MVVLLWNQSRPYEHNLSTSANKQGNFNEINRKTDGKQKHTEKDIQTDKYTKYAQNDPTRSLLGSRWKLLQLGLDEHYKKLNEFRNRDVPTTQDFLSVAVHYPWARAISQNKVPYYIK